MARSEPQTVLVNSCGFKRLMRLKLLKRAKDKLGEIKYLHWCFLFVYFWASEEALA